MKQNKASVTRTISTRALAAVRGGAERSEGGRHAEREAADTYASVSPPRPSVTIDVPYGGSMTVGPDGSTTWRPS